MSEITVTIGLDKIQEAFQQASEEIFKNSYSNPVKKLLEQAFSEKEGAVKAIVSEIITEAIGSPDFKTKMGEVIIQKMVEGAIKK